MGQYKEEQQIVLEETCAQFGKAIDTTIKEQVELILGRPIGFALLMFDLGGEGHIAYLSNAQRDDMIKAMEEFIEKVKKDAG